MLYRHGVKPSILASDDLAQKVLDSINTLNAHLDRGENIYGQ